jgi:iron complex transport system ATP-binding protein
VHGIDFELDQGEFVCIIGANGCGKTTTLKTLLGLLPKLAGTVKVAGQDTAGMPARELARQFAYIPQASPPPFPFTVGDVVILGRTPYLNRLSQVSAADREAARTALATLGIEALIERTYTHLSGGQRQLVLIARALAQSAKLLVMDEPTASLDFGNQQTVLTRLRDLADLGTSVLMVTHDPAHAFFCADRVIVMDAGLIVADGAPGDVITTQTMRQIYDIEVEVKRVTVADGQREHVCIPIRGHLREAQTAGEIARDKVQKASPDTVLPQGKEDR